MGFHDFIQTLAYSHCLHYPLILNILPFSFSKYPTQHDSVNQMVIGLPLEDAFPSGVCCMGCIQVQAASQQLCLCAFYCLCAVKIHWNKRKKKKKKDISLISSSAFHVCSNTEGCCSPQQHYLTNSIMNENRAYSSLSDSFVHHTLGL